jgi:SWI/SNF-related matrix-associated actin-dependent regulator of chromatin subfamily A-like protein 1
MKTDQRSRRRKSQSVKRFFFPKKKRTDEKSLSVKVGATQEKPSIPPSIPQAVAPAVAPEPVKVPTIVSKTVEVSVAPEKSKPPFKYSPRNSKGQHVIHVGIERGNRMSIRWPADHEALTEQLDTSTSALGRMLGRIEDIKGGGKKKLIPLSYYNAKKVLVILKAFRKMKVTDDKFLYDIILEEDFCNWYNEENDASKLCDNAGHLLEYDDSIQTEFEFLRKPLYPWQSAGMRFIDAITRHGKGAFICDETGLGKTYTVTAHLASQKLKAVVVCPSSLTESWTRKVKDISDLSVLVIESKYPMDTQTYDVIVVSYAMLKKHGDWPLSDIIDGQQRVLILDEGHFAKDYRSKRTKNALNLGIYAKHTIVMTATPIKNREKELHPLLRCTRRLWTEESMDDFSKYYTTAEGREEISERLSQFMIRRMFKEVKPDFPTGEVGEAWLELSNRKDYDAAEKDFISWLMSSGADQDTLSSAERGRALVKLNKLRQLSAEGKIASSIKIIEKTMDAGEQIIVFCAFRSPLFQIAEHFASKTGVNFKGQSWKGSAVIVGGVSKKKRYKIIDDFMDGKTGILCVGVGAGGLGIDLPIARFAYFLDLPWSPADFEQCTGRLLRLGQERNCQFIKMLADKSIDQRMEEIIQIKAKIFEEAIGDEDVVDRVTAKNADRLQQSVVSLLISSYIKDAVAA